MEAVSDSVNITGVESPEISTLNRFSDSDLKENEQQYDANNVEPKIKQLIFNKRQGTSGISGQIYEIELAMFFLLRGLMKKEDGHINCFYLAANMLEAGDFDDLVFKYKYTNNDINKERIIFLQAKHKDNPYKPKDKITIDRLLSDADKKEMFSLKDYFSSYRKIKETFMVNETDNEILGSKFADCDFLIFTNAVPHNQFNENHMNLKKISLEPHDILNFKESNCYYKLILGGDHGTDHKIKDILEYSSDCKKLAKELVNSLFPKDKQKSPEITMQGIFQRYHLPLAKEVIDKNDKFKEGKLKHSFLDNNDQLSLEGKIFREIFLCEVQKKKQFTQKSLDEIISTLKILTIKLPDTFWEFCGKLDTTLPNDLVTEADIAEFLNRLKLFINQPNVTELEDILKNNIQSVYKIDHNDIDAIFSNVKDKVESWWKQDNFYLTDSNTFFQESIRISIWFDVKKPVDLFTGRKQELRDLHNKIQRGSMTIISQITPISGLGGIGKTELARQYILQYSKKYYDNNIIWINAENEATLIESFERLATDKLGIKTTNADGKEKGITSIIEEIYKFFRKRKSLFVFDNAEKTNYLNKFLPLRALTPDANQMYILVTSRNREWDAGIEVLDLTELEKVDAITFVKKSLNVDVDVEDNSLDKSVENLVMKLQCFPLALQQAIAYIKDQSITNNFSIDNYLEEYEKKTQDLLHSNEFRGINNDYSQTTFTTWQITIDKIKNNTDYGELSLNILDAISYFASEKIYRTTFLNLASNNQKQLEAAVRLLIKFSMINGEQNQSILSIHRLVQEVIRLNLRVQNKEKDTLRKVLELLNSKMELETVDHAVAAWEYANQYVDLVKKFSDLPKKIINTLQNGVKYKEACLFGERQPKILQDILGQNHRDTVDIKGKVAAMLQKQGKYTEALNYYQELYNKEVQELGYNNPTSLKTLNGIAILLYRQGKYDRAQRVYEEVYEKQKKLLGPDHCDTLTTQHNLAGVYKSQGRYNKALKISQEILEKQERTLGRDDPTTLKTLDGMALILFKLGQYKESLELHATILEEKQKIYAKNHLEILSTENSMAAVLHSDGQYDRALEMFREVFQKRLELLGEDNPDTLMTMGNIATVLSSQEKFDEALQLQRQVLEKEIKVYGHDHPFTLAAMGSVATLLCENGKVEEAFKLVMEVFEKEKEILGPNHPDTLMTMHNIAVILSEQMKYNEALVTYQEVLEKRLDVLGPDHPQTIITQQNIKILHNNMKRLKDEIDVFLHNACLEGDIETVEKMLSDGIDPNVFDENRATALQFLHTNEDIALEIIKLLVLNGASVQLCNKWGWSALHAACKKGFLSVVEFLIDNGANPTIQNDAGLTPFHIAIEMGHFQIANSLINHGANIDTPDYSGYTPLFHAIRRNNFESVKYLIEHNADLTSVTIDGSSVLHLGVFGGNMKIIEEILKQSININIQDETGRTPLHWAAQNGHLEIVKHLVEKGATIDSKNYNNVTPLHFAAYHGNLDVIKYLLKKGADLNSRDRDYRTPLHRAAQNSKEEIVKYCREYLDNSKHLLIAAFHGDGEIVKQLLEGNIYVDVTHENGSTSLHLAAMRGHLEVVQLLLQYGADLLIKNHHDSILHQAVHSGNLKLVEFILKELKVKFKDDLQKFNDNINCKDLEGDTPLNWAAEGDKFRIAEILIEYGVNINATNDDGETALHWATRKGFQDIVQLLLDKGAIFNIPDINGKTAFDIALEILGTNPESNNLQTITALLMSVI